ncbi:MAG: hypothetical protein LBE58_13875 [Comamonas sp.]|jgi:hypothetical protein|nr:hypothetical protein [Comamonas sp.]
MFSNNTMKRLLATSLAFSPLMAWSQFVIDPAFKNSTAPGWSIGFGARLTAPGHDVEGNGWLNLSELPGPGGGLASYTGGSFSSSEGVMVEFDYVMWRRVEQKDYPVDALGFFVHDASIDRFQDPEQDPTHFFCGGVASYLAIAFDPQAPSADASECIHLAGPTDVIVLRGPAALNLPYVASAWVSGLNDVEATERPPHRSARITLVPTGDPATPFLVSLEDGLAGAMVPVITNQPFPFAAPEQLSISFETYMAAGEKDDHDIRLTKAVTIADIQVENTMLSPPVRRRGQTVSYSFKVKNNVFSGSTLSAHIDNPASAPLINASIPELINKTWICTASGEGTTCPAASGSGDLINQGNYTLGQRGELSFVFEGAVAEAAACDASVGTSATANFLDTAGFSDQDPSNNQASGANFVVDCSDSQERKPPQRIPTLSAGGLALLSLGFVGWSAVMRKRADRR